MLCYCCSNKPFAECCAPFLEEGKFAASCEALMRSRYSAYCRGQVDYIYTTTHPSQRQPMLAAEIKQFALSAHFYHLAIIASTAKTASATTGVVSFKAYFIMQNTQDVIAEESHFELIDRWYYHSGRLVTVPSRKLQRNDLCPCGSGKKVKQCQQHLISGQQQAEQCAKMILA